MIMYIINVVILVDGRTLELLSVKKIKMLAKHGGQHVSIHTCQLQVENKDQSINKAINNNEVKNLWKDVNI